MCQSIEFYPIEVAPTPTATPLHPIITPTFTVEPTKTAIPTIAPTATPIPIPTETPNQPVDEFNTYLPIVVF